jgi:hypothetical protein
MPLVIADGVQTADGEVVTDADLAVLRDTQVDVWARELAQIAIDELHEDAVVVGIDFPVSDVISFGNRFHQRVGEILDAAFTWARGGAAEVTPKDEQTITALITEQQTYAGGFISAIARGVLSKAEAVARAAMYAGAAIEAFERGRAAQWHLEFPAYPTEGCAGYTNCRCWWGIEEFPDRVELTWNAVGDERTCDWCDANSQEYDPYIILKGT